MHDKIYREFGQRLAALRKEAGFTQSEVAEKLNTVQSTYSGYELGTRKITLELISILSTILNTSPDYLILGETNAPAVTHQVIGLSNDDITVASAYSSASKKEKDLVRRILDLPPMPYLDLVEDEEPPLIAARGEQPSRGVMESQEAGIAEAILHAPRLTKENNDGIV